MSSTTVRFPGLGQRFSERLQMLGFWKDDHPDVGRFCREKGYRPQYVYAWLKDRMPAYDNMQRLASDLDVPVVWFVTGDGHEATAVPPDRAQVRRAHRPEGMLPLDLTPLREATDRIASLQADVAALLAAFPDPCWWFDDAGRVLDVNGATDDATALKAVGRSIRDVFPLAAAAALQRGLAQALKSHVVVTVEYALANGADRRERTWEARIRPVVERTGRRARKVLVVIREVTERYARETEYRDVIEGSLNGLCVHVGFTVQYANRGLARILGYENAERLVGRDVRELLPEHKHGRSASARGVSPKARTKALAKDGRSLDVMAFSRPITWRLEPATLLTVVPAPPAGGA